MNRQALAGRCIEILKLSQTYRSFHVNFLSNAIAGPSFFAFLRNEFRSCTNSIIVTVMPNAFKRFANLFTQTQRFQIQ